MTSLRLFSWRVVLPVAVLAVATVLVWVVLVGPDDGQNTSGEGSAPPVVHTPLPGEWSALAAAAEPSTVAIQTFQAGRIVRFGSGTVVSSDGLIATVLDVVPLVPSATYQVTLPGRILRAQVVRRDAETNLALLKVDASNVTIARMASARALLGAPLAVVGGTVSVSSYVPYFVHAWVSSDLQRYAVLDAHVATTIAGGRVLGVDGRQIGIVFLRANQVRMIWADTLSALVQEYIGSLREGASAVE